MIQYEVKKAQYPQSARHSASKIVIEPSGALVLYSQFPDTVVYAYAPHQWLEVGPVSNGDKIPKKDDCDK